MSPATAAAEPASPPTRVVLVPGVLALLPDYAGLWDPVADLRVACLGAIAWLGPDVEVLADAQGARVAAALLAAAGVVASASVEQGAERALRDPEGRPHPASTTGVLVVANGSATRSEKAPGHLDDRAAAYDDGLGAALRHGDTAHLVGLDLDLAAELWAGVTALTDLGRLLPPGTPAIVDYDDDPYGVQYWVMRWEIR